VPSDRAFPVTGVIAWYIRHGHNPANQPPRQMSHKAVDHPLTDLGVTQATALAARLARAGAPAAIYASPLRRAAQTAENLQNHDSVKHISENHESVTIALWY
jgi:broad specificity phosphatase PhoE